MVEFVLINSPMQRYSPDEKPDYQTTAPIGLGYIATVALKAKISIKIVDAEAEKLTISEIIERVNKMQPRIVGINMTSTNSDISFEILDKIKAELKVVGGPYATLSSDLIDSKKYLIIKGEAENVLIDSLKKGKTGIVEGGIIEDLDKLPFLERSLFKNEPYVNSNGKLEVSISTTRGCANNCVFCSVPVLSGKRVRARSLDNVFSEIIKLKKEGINSLHFIDDTFNFKRKRVEEFCNYLIKNKLNISWRALCRIEGVDVALLKKMKKSGCYKIGFGIESVSESVLSYIGKYKNIKAIKNTFDICKKIGIQTKAFFTIGYPSESSEEILKTLDFIDKLKPNDICVTVVRAYPGTKLYNDMVEKGMDKEDLNKYHQFKGKEKHIKYHVMNVNSLNGMSMNKLDKFINEAYHRFNVRQAGVQQ